MLIKCFIKLKMIWKYAVGIGLMSNLGLNVDAKPDGNFLGTGKDSKSIHYQEKDDETKCECAIRGK